MAPYHKTKNGGRRGPIIEKIGDIKERFEF